MLSKRRQEAGQTSVDFLIGFSIFAMTLLFVLQMASGSVVTISSQSQTQEALAERAAALAHNNISENGSFEQAYETANDSLDTGEGIEYGLNFTAMNISEGGVSYTEGGTPENTTSSVAGDKRVVNYDYDGNDDLHLLEIKVWQNGTR